MPVSDVPDDTVFVTRVLHVIWPPALLNTTRGNVIELIVVPMKDVDINTLFRSSVFAISG